MPEIDRQTLKILKLLRRKKLTYEEVAAAKRINVDVVKESIGILNKESMLHCDYRSGSMVRLYDDNSEPRVNEFYTNLKGKAYIQYRRQDKFFKSAPIVISILALIVSIIALLKP